MSASPDQPEFSFIAAAAARDEAIDRVEANAADHWKAAAEFAALEVARRGKPFTTDEVWRALVLQGVGQPHEPRAMGAIFRKLAREGVIRPLEDDFQKSIMTACHRRPKQRWIAA